LFLYCHAVDNQQTAPQGHDTGEDLMMPAEFDVTGKVVFITGAGRGIGKGIAQVLAVAGADIALNA
jgi:S-adenosylhomocysteine hydrolase